MLRRAWRRAVDNCEAAFGGGYSFCCSIAIVNAASKGNIRALKQNIILFRTFVDGWA